MARNWRQEAERATWDGGSEALARFVPAGLLVQLAASHAAIGPFAATARETPQRAASHYRHTARGTPRRHLIGLA